MPKQAFRFPLSFAQQRLWFLNRLAPASPVYNLAFALRLSARLNSSILERSLNEIVRRHEILRTTFVMVENAPAQIVTPNAQFALKVVSLEHLEPGYRMEEVLRIANTEAQAPFDLARGPLLRAVQLRMAEDDHVFVLAMHHIVSDAWSVRLLLQELNAIYPAFVAGRPCPLDELPIQYADFAVWQRESFSGESLERQLKYWKRQLAHLPQLQIPTDGPRPAQPSFLGDEYLLRLPATLVTVLNDLGRREGATLFMTLLAAFQVLLSRYSGQDDIVVGSPIAGRNRTETERLIGFFVNTLVLRVDLGRNLSFRQLLHRVREMTLGAFSNQDLPFEMLVEALEVERDLSRNPLFQLMFQLRNTSPAAEMKRSMNASTFPLQRVAATFDLTVSLWETDEELRGSIEYNSDLFESDTIARFAKHYGNVLRSVAADPDQPVSGVRLEELEESRRVLLAWNASAESLPSGICVHHVLEQKITEHSDDFAIEFQGGQLTYAQLNSRANRIARHLRRLGAGPEVIVGVFMERSPAAIEAILGVLKAGAAYLPLEPNYPKERIGFILRDAVPAFVITEERLRQRLPESGCRVVCLDQDGAAIAGQSDTNLDSGVMPVNLAYVIYTSGSTGIPKGVLVSHAGVVNVLLAQLKCLPVTRDSRVLQFASFTFDASIFEIVLALGAGATLCLGTPEEYIPGSPLARFISDHRITVAVLPPSVLGTLSQADCPNLDTIMVAGEACSGDLVSDWAPGRKFFNLYGPTEATIWTTVARCDSATRKPSIGKPIPNTQGYVLDREQKPVPVGIPGEIYIGGLGLARGYIGRPDANAESFVPDPFNPGSPDRLYKSGDIARYLPNGELDFLGRADQQIKVNGFRIELGEIEALLSRYSGVKEAVVIGRKERDNPGSLVAYVTPADGKLVHKRDLRDFAQERLPAFMVPSIFVILETMPRLPSGKIDRRSLPKPEHADLSSSAEFEAPRTDLEQQIARVWIEVLGVEKVGVHDSFFELGGNSLMIAQVHSKLEGVLQRQVGILDLFRYPTIHLFAKHQSAATSIETRWFPRITASTEQLANMRRLRATRREAI
jgi:amino acid adenylation domain-containing protein